MRQVKKTLESDSPIYVYICKNFKLNLAQKYN